MKGNEKLLITYFLTFRVQPNITSSSACGAVDGLLIERSTF